MMQILVDQIMKTDKIMPKTKNKKNTIVSNPVSRKEYNYQMDGVTLAFNLRQDNPKEMLVFTKLCELAIIDIGKDIKNIRK